ncbi:MAG TPA: GNAT family N-acetyltransferase [Streptosporangiaceae bacterium]|nr:GNAT family N-acetyltransferase [Streptosporangiaceae bacterium]
MAVRIEVLHEVTDDLVEAFARLLPQLSRSAPPLDRAALTGIVSSAATTLLVARSGDQIVGTLSLVMFRIPTGLRAWIEDVIVDQGARGQGIGVALTEEALRLAEAAGARTVDLTSRPSREAAGRLYERAGFRSRETRAFRYTFAAGPAGPAG